MDDDRRHLGEGLAEGVNRLQRFADVLDAVKPVLEKRNPDLAAEIERRL